MAPVEINFLAEGWESEGQPTNRRELVETTNEPTDRDFNKNGKHFTVVCGTIRAEGMHDRTPHNRGGIDDGAVIHFWDESTEFEGVPNTSLRRLKEVGHTERAHAHAEIGIGGFVKLTVDGESVAEIRHFSRRA